MATMTSKQEYEKNQVPPTIPMNAKETRTSTEVGSVDGLDVLALATDDHPAHPRNWPLLKRLAILGTLCFFEAFILMTSTAYLSIKYLIQEQFNSSTQVTSLGQSLFIVGNAIGPLCLGPLSDIAGRRWVYSASCLLYAIFNIGCAFPRNIAQVIIFSFLSGVAGSTAVTNVAASVSDMFAYKHAGQAMALFVVGANIGPSVGSPIGEAIAENLGYQWWYYINIILGTAFAVILALLPETQPTVVILKAAGHGDDPLAEKIRAKKSHLNVAKEVYFVASEALKILFTEPIVAFLGVFNGFAYGLLFLYLEGMFIVFTANNGMSYMGASLTYLNLVVGVLCMFAYQPIQDWLYRRDAAKRGGRPRPEARFLTSLVTVWLFPISLFWFAFTSDGATSWVSPLFAGGVLGFCNPVLWLGMLNYITDSYPSVAASAIAAFSLPSFTIAAGLVHAGIAMFENMTTTWASATLAFVSLMLVVLVYVLYFFGPWLRKRSPIARDPGSEEEITNFAL